MGRARVGVLASGLGRGLEAILLAGLPIDLLVVDRPCRAAEVAEAWRVPCELVLRASDRVAFTQTVTSTLLAQDIDVVVMAGFMTILAAPLVDAFDQRVLNVHPSLLPAFPGAHAVRDALAAGVTVTGCTVHIATERVDDGPILAQEAVPVLPGDTPGALEERIIAVEHSLYPETIRRYLATITS